MNFEIGKEYVFIGKSDEDFENLAHYNCVGIEKDGAHIRFSRYPYSVNVDYSHRSLAVGLIYARDNFSKVRESQKDDPNGGEGLKYDEGKPAVGLIDSKWLLETTKVLDFGAKKYAAHNWRKGMSCSRLYDSVLRHLLAWNDGETIDPESGLNHLAHASCGLMFLYNTSVTKPEMDDRYTKEES